MIIIHAGPGLPGERQAVAPARPRGHSSRRGGKHRANSFSLLDLLERVLTTWPITLRLGILLLILLTGLSEVAITAGVISQLVLAMPDYYIKRT